MKWYVIQVKTTKELDVRDTLQKHGIPAKVPQELRLIRKKGEWENQLYVLMPGYVFFGVEVFGADEYYAIKKIPNVIKILGEPKPQHISYEEAEYINLLAPTNEPLEASKIEITGDDVKIVSGILTKIPARLLKFEPRRKRAKIELSILGKPKVLELSAITGNEDAGEIDD